MLVFFFFWLIIPYWDIIVIIQKKECDDLQVRVCPAGISWFFNNRMRLLSHNPKNIMGDYVKRGYIAADIGCGPGFFSLALAEMVGEEGRVIAVDIQKEMLDQVAAGAERLKLRPRIILHQCKEDSLGIDQKADFILAFWMVHEVPNVKKFFEEIVTILKPAGLLLLVEPRFHVSASTFQEEIKQACAAGLKPCKEVKVNLSRGMLFSFDRNRGRH
jgi:ubiquinone/menaquinone biosynthesis C-methylase UbiE